MSLPGHHKPRAVRLAAACGALLVVGACLESTIVQVSLDDVAELQLSPDSADVAIGFTLQAQALTVDDQGTLLVGLDVAWSSVDPTVASVSDQGLVLGVGSGTTQIVASAAGFSDTSTVVVAPPPVLVLSADSVHFTAQAGEAEPPPDTIDVTNGGAFPLVGLAVDSIVYASDPGGWLTAQFAASTGPTELEVAATAAGLTDVDVHVAVVWVSAVDADGSPAAITVVLEVDAGTAASIEVNAGDGQSAQVGTAVSAPPSVLVLDQFDNPVPGVEVTFAVTGGGGSVTGDTDTTDVSGVARVGSWTLGGAAGPNTLDATLAAVGTVTFTATGEPGPATDLQIAGGNGQSAIAGSPVSTSPSVIALDAFDNPIEGVVVTFEVTSGGGSITGSPATTVASGVATAGTWTLEAVGSNTLDAIAASIPDTVTFTATGIVGSVDDIVLVAGDAQTDTVAATLTTQYAVRVEDINDNPIPGVTISWEVVAGGGAIGGAASSTSDTDASGVAVATRVLGTAPGTHTALATIGGVPDTVNFSATALVGTPSMLVALSPTAQSDTVGRNVAQPPSVRVTDSFDNPIAGHAVTFAVSAGGAISPAGAVSTLADGTVTLTSWTLDTLAATNSDTVTVTPSGATVAPNPLRFIATATADVPNSIAIVQGGTTQTAITGANVAQAPTVLVRDQYMNPVPNRQIDFTQFGGSVGSPMPSTDASGQASTTWAPNVSGGTMQANGTFPDTLTATVEGTGLNVRFFANAIYSYGTHVDSVFVNNCTGCHGGSGGLTFVNGNPGANRASLVLTSNCGGLPRVSTAGGTTGVDNSIVLLYLVTGASPPCAFNHFEPSGWASRLALIEAWIRNMAPDN